MSTLSRDQKQRVAAMMKARDLAIFGALLRTETDLDVLRQLNWQLKRLPKSARGEALNNRLEELTGRRPSDGLSGHERWFTRGASARAHGFAGGLAAVHHSSGEEGAS